MSFSKEWDQRFQENTHLSVWPWSDLVSLVRRNCKNLTKDFKVLELGCGAGANIPFFLSLGIQYHAIEGSKIIVSQLHHRFPELTECIITGDFTIDLPFTAGFDLVVDRAAVTCNSTAGIKNALQLTRDLLMPGGYFIGVDWYSMQMSDYQYGKPGPDDFTRTGFESGTFTGTGNVHFSNKDHLQELFEDFEIVALEEKTIHHVIPAEEYQFASWQIVARKK